MTTPHQTPAPTRITYFVAFQAPGGVVGNTQLTLSGPITGIKTIKALSARIAQDGGYGTVVITGWQRFETTGSATVCRCQHPDPEDI